MPSIWPLIKKEAIIKKGNKKENKKGNKNVKLQN